MCREKLMSQGAAAALVHALEARRITYVARRSCVVKGESRSRGSSGIPAYTYIVVVLHTRLSLFSIPL